jgi:CubicO group peptidase (beta-lactamase class C family)
MIKNMLIRIVLICALLAGLFGKGNAQTIESLLEQLSNHLDNRRIPGMMLSIVKSDTILYSGGLGYANLETKEEVTEKHLFRLGSISKSLTALGILHLFDSLDMPLNTPIAKIDPTIPFSNKWEEEYPVTVANILEHTSGFDNFHFHAIYNKTDEVEPSASDMVFSHRRSLTSRWQPGQRKAYSNPNFIVAGQILETLSGKTYREYIKEELLDPMGMEETDFYFKKPENDFVAQGYKRQGNEHKIVPFYSIQGGPAGGLCSNAEEFSKLMQLLLKGNHEDSMITDFFDKHLGRIENAQTTIPWSMGMPGGYGLGNYTVWKNGYLFHGHDGGIDGFSSRYLYSREADIGVVVSINRMGNATEIAEMVLDYFLGEEKSTPNRVAIPEEIKAEFGKFYCFKNPTNELISFSDRMLAGLKLDMKDDHIIVRNITGKPKDTLYYAGDNLFFKNEEKSPSVALFKSEDDESVMWFNESYTVEESRLKRIIQSLAIVLSMILPFFFIAYGLYKVIRIAVNKHQSDRRTSWLFC